MARTTTIIVALFFLITLALMMSQNVAAPGPASKEGGGGDAAANAAAAADADPSAQGERDATSVDYNCLADCLGKCNNGYNMKECTNNCYEGCTKTRGEGGGLDI